MKQLVRSPAGFRVVDAPLPFSLADGVVVRVQRSLVSPGTELLDGKRGLVAAGSSIAELLTQRFDLVKRGVASLRDEGLKRTWDATLAFLAEEMPETLPAALAAQQVSPTGYSAAGIVVETGRGAGLPQLGSRVVCAGAQWAFHAEYIAVPRHLCAVLPATLSFDQGAFGSLGSIAMHALRRADARLGEQVVVVGLGLVGLLVAQLSKAAGHRTLGIELDPERVALAKSLGIEVLDPALAADPVAAVRERCGGRGADRVLLCLHAKDSGPLNQAFQMSRRRGRVVLVGQCGLTLERRAMYEGEVDLVISTSSGPGRYDRRYEEEGLDYPYGYVRWTEHRNLQEFLRLVAAGAVELDPLVGRRVEIDGAPACYEDLQAGPERPVGVIIEYPDRPEAPLGSWPHPPSSRLAVQEFGPRMAPENCRVLLKGPIGLGIIGCGDHVKVQHLPILTAAPEFRLIGVVNSSAQSSARASRETGIPAASGVDALLADEAVKLILIASHHDSHAALAQRALEAGKHVVLEKPLALTRDSLAALREAHEAHPELLLATVFNRRYAPGPRDLAERLGSAGSGMLLLRVDGGAIPAGHWSQDPHRGGGRVLGEACHMIDLLSFLAGDGELEELLVAGDGAALRDSFSATLRFSSGSVAVLVYTSRGAGARAAGWGKERIEAFVGGESLWIDDYRGLCVAGSSSGAAPDKGFGEFWRRVAGTLLVGAEGLAPTAHAFRATELCLRIDERLRGRPPIL